MRPRSIWISLLLMGAAALVYHYQIRPKLHVEPSKPVALLAIDTADLKLVRFQYGTDQECLLSREGDRWLVSDGMQTDQAREEVIERFFAAVANLHSDSILPPGAVDAWAQRHTRITFLTSGSPLTVFLWLSSPTQNRAALGFQTGQETYGIDYRSARACALSMDELRQRSFLTLPATFTPDTIALTVDSVRYLLASVDGGLWPDDWPDGQKERADRWLRSLNRLNGSQFAAPEAVPPAEERPAAELILKSDTSAAYAVKMWRRASVEAGPFILQSSQYRHRFFSSDSSGLYEQTILSLWRLLNETSQ